MPGLGTSLASRSQQRRALCPICWPCLSGLTSRTTESPRACKKDRTRLPSCQNRKTPKALASTHLYTSSSGCSSSCGGWPDVSSIQDPVLHSKGTYHPLSRWIMILGLGFSLESLIPADAECSKRAMLYHEEVPPVGQSRPLVISLPMEIMVGCTPLSWN